MKEATRVSVQKKDALWTGLLLYGAGIVLYVIMAPLDIFLINSDDFPFDFIMLLKPLVLAAIVLFAAGAVLLFVLWKYGRGGVYDAVLITGYVVFLCCYVQGQFLSGGLPLLDGVRVNWSAYTTQHIVSIVLWAAVTAVIIILLKKHGRGMFYRIAGATACLVVVMMLAGIISSGITHDSFHSRTRYTVTSDQCFTYSSDRNLIMFLIDMTEAEVFLELLEEDDIYADYFEDFTFFPDTVSAYPYTDYSVPFMIGGNWLEEPESLASYWRHAVDGSPLLERLREEDYSVGIYSTELQYDKTGLDIENVLPSSRSFGSHRVLFENEAKLILFKYLPYGLKQLIPMDDVEFTYMTTAVTISGENAKLFREDNRAFLDDMRETPFTIQEKKCFRFIHVLGSHLPYRYDRFLQEIDPNDGTYKENMRGALYLTHEYLEALKEADVYDNSAIIVLADHGGQGLGEPDGVGRQNPLFLVKGIGERHPMKQSLSPISFDDLQEAYGHLLEGKSSEDAFPFKQGDKRERKYMLYDNTKYPYLLYECIQTGFASDDSTIQKTGKTVEY